MGNIRNTNNVFKVVVAVILLVPLLIAAPAQAASWSGNVVLSDPRPSATSVGYTLSITAGATTTANAVKCVIIEYDTSADGTGGIPTGLSGLATSTLSGTFTSANALSTFTRDATSAAVGILKFTHATGGTGSNGTVILSGVTNGSTADTSFFVRYNTYNNTDCTSSAQDSFVVAAIWTNGTVATIRIDPSLSYTINSIAAAGTCNGVTTTDASTSTSLDMRPTLVTNKVSGQRHDVATNATGGYSLYMREAALPTVGTDNIDALTVATYASPTAFSAAGTEAWGFSTNDAALAGGTGNRFTSGGAKWAPITTAVPGDVVADSAAPISGAGGQTQLCFQVGAGTATAAGVYTTTVIYTAAGNF